MPTEIHVIVDRSGSMYECIDDTIGGFNTFLANQKADTSDECFFSLYQFDHEYTVSFKNKPIQEVEPLTKDSFQPRGQTALLDAIGRTIIGIGDSNNKIIVVIQTDGQDNSSKEFDKNKIKEMIKQKEDEDWKVIFLGANQDAITAAGSLGINQNRAMSYSQTPQHVNSCFRSLSAAVSRNRSGAGDTGFTEIERTQSIQK